MTLRYLVNRRRKQWDTAQKQINLDFVKDAVIAQLQAVWTREEIMDIDFGEVTPEGMMNVTIYFNKKGVKSKTKKD